MKYLPGPRTTLLRSLPFYVLIHCPTVSDRECVLFLFSFPSSALEASALADTQMVVTLAGFVLEKEDTWAMEG